MTVSEFVNQFVGHNSTITIYARKYNSETKQNEYEKLWQGMDWQVCGNRDDDKYCQGRRFEICPYRDLPVMQIKQFPHGEFSDYVDLCIEPLSSLIEPMVQAVREGFLLEKYGTEREPVVDETIELNLSGLRNYELRYLAESGFRKADEVRKETAKEIIKLIDAYARYTNKGVSGNYMLIQLNRDDVEGLKSRIKDLCGIEVDK